MTAFIVAVPLLLSETNLCYGLINFVTKALGFRGRAGALILEKRE